MNVTVYLILFSWITVLIVFLLTIEFKSLYSIRLKEDAIAYSHDPKFGFQILNMLISSENFWDWC